MYRFMRFPEFRSKALTLSYDDGTVFDKKLMEIMQKHGLKGTFNINSGLFAEKEGERRMTERECVELFADSGMEVAVHGIKHLSLAEVPDEIVLKEVLGDRENLEKLFGRQIRGMAYANGSYSDRVVGLLKGCGIKYSRTTVSTESFDIPTDWLRLPATCHHKNPKLFGLLDLFLEKPPENLYFWNKAYYPRLFYLWGHSYEFNDCDNWDIMEKFAEKAGNRDDVWYCTNGELYDYVKAYDSLEYSVDGASVFNPTSTSVWLDFGGGDELVLKSGETAKIKGFFR